MALSIFQRHSARARAVVVLVVAALAAAPVAGAPPSVSPLFLPVTIDGTTAGWTTFAGSGQAFNVIYDGSTFHLWYRTDLNTTISDIQYATSTNGRTFTSQGGPFSFSADPFPTGTPPAIYYDAVSQVGSDYKIIHWTPFGSAGTYPAYEYNNSVSNIGPTISNTVVTHQGAISGGTFGQTGGSFGIVGGTWFGQCGLAREVCAAPYTDTSPPSVPASIYPAVLDATAFFASEGNAAGYINNHGDVQAGGIGLDMAFTMRDSGGARFNQQVYFSESSNGGASWTAPVGLLSGAPQIFGGFGSDANFAHPELIRASNGTLLYVSTQLASGEYVIAVSDSRPLALTPTQPVPALDPASLALLLSMLAFAGFYALRRREARSR